jgi:hypothetical protein
VYVLDHDQLTIAEFMNPSQAKACRQKDSSEELCRKLCLQAEYSEDYEDEVEGNQCRVLNYTSNIFKIMDRLF